MSRTLLLSPWMKPLKVISWEAAVRLVYQKKAHVLETYDEEISSPSVTWRMPAVICLSKPLKPMKEGIKFSRINVFTRDGFRCQYCGDRKSMRELNYDHVVPRVRGGKTNWTNIVTACYPCNDKKAGRTPEEAGMRLLRAPIRPKSLPHSYVAMDRKTIPEIWEPYCAANNVEDDGGSLFLMTGSS